MTQLLAVPMGGLGNLQPPAPPTRPHVTAQIMELNARVGQLAESPTVTVGDIVVERDGLGYMLTECRTNTPMKIVRMLDPYDAIDQRVATTQALNTRIDGLDCMVAWISDDGARVVFFPHNTRMLRKFEE